MTPIKLRTVGAGAILRVGLILGLLGARLGVAAPADCAARAAASGFEMQATMNVTGKPKERLYLHILHPDACSSSATDDECNPTTYIITGDSVSAGSTCGDWTQIEYRGKWGEIYAWVDSTRLSVANDLDYDVCTIRLSSDDLQQSFDTNTPRLQRELYAAVRKGHGDSVRTLLAKGARANMRGPSQDWLISDAVAGGDPVIVQALLKAGANPNVTTCGGPTALGHLELSSTPVNEAALLKIADDLLQAGAKLTGLANAPWRQQLIAGAAGNGHRQLLAWLFDHGAKIDTPAIDYDVLKAAIDGRQEATLEMLLANGANPNTDESLQPSPLIEAIDVGNPAMVRLLLEHGANSNVRTVLGTPLSEAIGRQRTTPQSAGKYGEIIALLKQHGETDPQNQPAEQHP